MPHTNKKKKRGDAQKRAEVIDDDGWTRVTTKSQSHNVLSSHPVSGGAYDPSKPPSMEPLEKVQRDLGPLEAPSNASVESIKVVYERLQRLWLGSDSYQAVQTALKAQMNAASKIERCILFGSGSFCGMRQGWIGRHEVALLQTAVFISAVDIIEQMQGLRPECFAQEPQYNPIDVDFLSTIRLTALQDPQGFEKASERTFVYAPGAEAAVLLRILYRVPELLLSSDVSLYVRMEDGAAQARFEGRESTVPPPSEVGSHEERQAEHENNARVCKRFLHGHGRIRLPDLEMANHPFHQQSLYYRSEQEDT